VKNSPKELSKLKEKTTKRKFKSFSTNS